MRERHWTADGALYVFIGVDEALPTSNSYNFEDFYFGQDSEGNDGFWVRCYAVSYSEYIEAANGGGRKVESWV